MLVWGTRVVFRRFGVEEGDREEIKAEVLEDPFLLIVAEGEGEGLLRESWIRALLGILRKLMANLRQT